MMSDTDVDETNPEESTGSLYDEIVEISGIEYDENEFDTVEEWKRQVVRWFDKNYQVGDDEAEKKFEEDCSQVLQDWVADAATVVKENKTAKRKKTIPAVDGFPGEDNAKPAKKTKEKKAKAEKPPKEAKERGPSRYERVMQFMKDHPNVTEPEKIAAGCDVAVASIGYCIEAARSAARVYGNK